MADTAFLLLKLLNPFTFVLITYPLFIFIPLGISAIGLLLIHFFTDINHQNSVPTINKAGLQKDNQKITSKPKKHSNPSWSDEEIILALDFYFHHSPHIPAKNSKEIYELSQLIKNLDIHQVDSSLTSFRNENGVFLKLMNLASLDPEYEGKGMGNASIADRKIWNKYTQNQNQLKLDAQKIKLNSKNKNDNSIKETSNIQSSNELINVIKVYKQASNCNQCFDRDADLKRDKIFGGQPRWIGLNYFDQHLNNPRVVVLLRSPGILGKSKSFSLHRYKELLTNLDDLKYWNELMTMIDSDSSNWGNFNQVYKEHMELDLKYTAFLNIGLCSGFNAINSASQTKAHLTHCFNTHTRQILELLQPQVLILSGAIVRDIYYEEVEAGNEESKALIQKNFISNDYFNAEAVRMPSYAARGPYVRMKAEEVGEELKNI